MSKTPIYQLGYFVPNLIIGDELDLDQNRFTTIENQLYNVYNIFGNGILDKYDSNGARLPSWLLSQIPNEKTIQISDGKGHVSYKYAETDIAYDLELELPPGSTTGTFIYYFYAVANETTPVDKGVDFIYSLTQIVDLENYIGLGAAELIINSDGTFSINVYNDAEHGRQEISLIASLGSFVKNHVHIGGPNNPSPIDLERHVTGFLSSDNIGEINLNKVTSGTLDPNRLPAIDHNDLLNIGSLTHEQIDALLAALQYPDNNYKISDYGIVNRLQIVLALKKQTGFFNIDGQQLNSVFYVPYTNMSSFVDVINTTATVDTNIHRVYGVTGIPRQSNVIKINSTQDFNTALFYAEDAIPFPVVDNIEVTGVTTVPVAGTINNPHGITGSAATIYVSSYSDSFISSFSTTGVYINRRIDFDPNLNLNSPMALWYDSTTNYLYIADTFNHRIIVTDGDMVNTIAKVGKNLGSGLPGSNSSEFSYPKGVFGLGNTFYVADSGNNRIQRFEWQNSAPVYSKTYYFTEYSDRTIDGLHESLSDPRGVIATYYDNSNFLFVADFGNHRVLCGTEVNNRYQVYDVLAQNSGGYGIASTILITYGPSAGSVGSGASFSFGTSLNETIFSISVTAAGSNHEDTDTYNLYYPGKPNGLIYVSTNGAGGVTTAFVSYGISTDRTIGFSHPQGIAVSSEADKMYLFITDTDNNRLSNFVANVGSGFGVTENLFKYNYSIGTFGSQADSGSLIYFNRPTHIHTMTGFATGFVADNLNNRIHKIYAGGSGFGTNAILGVAATTFGIGDTSLTSGGITLEKPFSYIGLANTSVSGAFPDNWYIGEVITQGTTIQADDIDRYNYTIFSQLPTIDRDTVAVALQTINEEFPSFSLGKIDCYLIFQDDSSEGTETIFNLSSNANRSSIRISNLVTVRLEGSTLTNFNNFFNLSQFTSEIDTEIIGFGFKWSTNSGWANADVLNLGWYLPQFNTTTLYTNHPTVLQYRQANGLQDAVFLFNSNRYSQSGYFVFRFDSGSAGNAEFNYAIFSFSEPLNSGNESEINFYYRVSDTLDQLNSNRNFQEYDYDVNTGIISGSELGINQTARYIDLIFELNSSSDYLAAPVISSISLYYSVYGQNLGVIYDTDVNNAVIIQYPRFKWSQGEEVNILVSPVQNNNTQSYQIGIANSSDVGKYIYLSAENLVLSTSDGEETLVVDVNNSLYLSPYQVFTSSSPGLLNPQHYISNDNDGYFIADTDNDRILEVDENGAVSRAIQGNIRLSRSDRDFVVTGAYYNTELRMIFVLFSQHINLPQNYQAQLSVFVNGNSYLLTDPVYFVLTDMGLYKINSNSKSATFYASVTDDLDTILTENPSSAYFQIQNTSDTPPFEIPTTGRSDGYDLEDDTITYNRYQFGEFSPNGSVGVGTILNYSSNLVFNVVDPTIFALNNDTPSDVLLSYTEENQEPPYSNFYSIPIQVFPVYIDNIFKPIYLDYTDNSVLVATTVGNASIRAYNSSFESQYSVSLTKFSFNEKLGGSVYVLDRTELDLGNILLVAEPTNGITTIVGRVSVYDRNKNIIINHFDYRGFDTVKALPDGEDYLILLHDRQASGLRSKLIKVSPDGRINYSLTNVFTRPVSLDIKENEQYYVTDTTGQIGTIFVREFVDDGGGNLPDDGTAGDGGDGDGGDTNGLGGGDGG